MNDRERALELIGRELSRAIAKHAPMHSAHEAYAVILEELDEVKAEVWSRSRNHASLAHELVQTAAMCARALVDLGLVDIAETRERIEAQYAEAED